MVIGILFIIAGILIIIYPPLLAFIIATAMIFLGIALVYVSLYYKKMSKKFNDPFIDFFFRL